MKKKAIILLSILSSFLLSACQKAPSYKNLVSVSLLEVRHVTSEDERIKYINYGDNASFTFTVEDGYSYKGCDYSNYRSKYITNTKIEITLIRVYSNTKVKLDIARNDAVMKYHPNGGNITTGEEVYTSEFSLKNHLRPNTLSANNKFVREGYQLVSWNTKEDGTGTRIGLGSRVTIDNNEKSIDLYALWKKETDSSLFVYEEIEGGLNITSCLSHNEEIVIPQFIDSKKVISIKENAFSDLEVKDLFVPTTITSIDEGAFNNCELTTITMSDSVTTISDDSFVNCPNLKTLYINAYHDPVYINEDRHSVYADKIDLLILSEKDELPRLVFEGDSGVWFNIHGETISNKFKDKYNVINVGLNGFYSGVAQLQILKHLLRGQDQLVHIVAPNSVQQVLNQIKMTENMWTVLELNYDLFSYVDLSSITDVFDTYKQYMDIKLSMVPVSYQNGVKDKYIDDCGCIPFYMPEVNDDVALLDDASINISMYDEQTVSRLNSYYDEIQNITHAKVMYGFGAVNYDGLKEEEREYNFVNNYVQKVKSSLNGHAYILDHLYDNMYRGHFFYETNFHLTTDAGKYYTEQLANHIKEYLG